MHWFQQTAMALAVGVVLGTPTVAVEPQPDRPRRVESFPIGREGRVIILPVTVGGQEYPFLFDTGASSMVYDTSLRFRLGASVGEGKAQTPDGVIAIPSFDSIPAQLGELSLRTNEPVFCMDMEHVRQAIGKDVRGAVGIRSFRAYVVQIDFDGGTLSILEPPQEPAADWGRPIPLHYSDLGIPYVLATVGRGEKAPFLVDTGNNSTGSIQRALFAHLLHNGALKLSDEISSVSAAGRTEQRIGRLASFALGPFAHDNLAFADDGVSALGLRYWSRYRVTLDLPNEKLYLRKGKRYQDADHPDMTGLTLLVIDRQLAVHSVDEGKPAALAGIKAGDIILTIQGQPAGIYELFELHRHVFVVQGKRIDMTIKRGSETIPVAFVLKPTRAGPTATAVAGEATSTPADSNQCTDTGHQEENPASAKALGESLQKNVAGQTSAVADAGLKLATGITTGLREPVSATRATEHGYLAARTVRFPADRSLGTLKIRDWGTENWWHERSVEWQEYCEASGLVTIPAGKELSLWVGQAEAADLSPLAQLGPDALQALVLTDTNVADAELRHLRALMGLRYLNVSGTSITDDGLVHVSSLPALQTLYLAGCQKISDRGLKNLRPLTSLHELSLRLCRQITDEGIQHLAGLTGLRFLDLGYTRVTSAGLAHLKKMRELEFLGLIGTRISDEGLAHLSGLKSLRTLWLTDTKFGDAGLAHVAGLTSLERLWMGGSDVTDRGLAHLAGLTNLKELILRETKAGDEGLAHLAGSTSLERLTPPPGTTDAGLEHLAGMRHLRRLALQETKTTTAGLVHLKELDALCLQLPTGLTDEDLARVGDLTSLRGLGLQNSPEITDAGLAHLSKLKSLNELLIRGLDVGREAYSVLKDLPHLERLDLQPSKGLERSAEGNSWLEYVDGLQHLQVLDVSRTDVGDADLAHLRHLSRLEGLLLIQTDITDAGLIHLKHLPSLQWVSAKNTRVTEAGAAGLRGVSFTLPGGKVHREPSGSDSSEDSWHRYVREFIETYRLDPSQQETAHSILREMCNEAVRHRRSKRTLFEALDARLQDLGSGRPTGDGERATFRQALQEAKRQRQNLEHPITVEMFNRLKERLERIPTATQREGRR